MSGVEPKAIHFLDQPIKVTFNTPPEREKRPPCPDAFTWEGRTFRIVETLSEWTDFTRRGRNARLVGHVAPDALQPDRPVREQVRL